VRFRQAATLDQTHDDDIPLGRRQADESDPQRSSHLAAIANISRCGRRNLERDGSPPTRSPPRLIDQPVLGHRVQPRQHRPRALSDRIKTNGRPDEHRLRDLLRLGVALRSTPNEAKDVVVVTPKD